MHQSENIKTTALERPVKYYCVCVVAGDVGGGGGEGWGRRLNRFYVTTVLANLQIIRFGWKYGKSILELVADENPVQKKIISESKMSIERMPQNTNRLICLDTAFPLLAWNALTSLFIHLFIYLFILCRMKSDPETLATIQF